MRMPFARGLAALAAFGSVLAATPVSAQGDLLVAPTRIILDGRRGTEVILSNIGSEEATYRIGLELRRMAKDGSLIEVEPEKVTQREQSALDMIRYAPRRITLPPGQPQAVRIGARPAADLPDGEYRAHMSFEAIPKARSIAADAEPATGISVQLIPIYGVTIPVIVRNGNVEAQVAMNQPRIVQGERGPQLQLTINRSGKASTYGELRVLPRGSDKPIYMARGIAVYPEVQERDVILPLSAEQAAAMTGPLRFEYREMPEAGGGLIASVDAVLG